jgi:hypothetical protein
MTLRRMILIILTVPLVLFISGGCTAGQQPELSPARLACIEMMQQVPVYYEDFEFWDAEALREDSDLMDMYKVWYERKVDFLEERYGMQSESIEYLAQGEGLLDIIEADYDIGALRDSISLDFYRDTAFEDMEVWKSPPAHDPQSVTGGWVLAEGLLVRGANNSNVDDYLRVATGEELSMYDGNAAGLLDRLPEGVMIRMGRSAYPVGVVVSGMSVRKEGSDTLSWTNVYMFENAEAVRSLEVDEYFNRIEDDFARAQDEMARRGETPPFADFSLEVDEEFVRWSISVETKYMVALLFYG